MANNTSEISLLLHFLKFDIESHSLPLRPLIERLYVSNDLREYFPNYASSLKLHIESVDSPQALPLAAPNAGVFTETQLCDVPCFYQDGRFFSAYHSPYWHELEYDLRRHTIRANLGGEYLRDGQAIISHIIRHILQSFILPFYNLKTLHGAVLHKNGRTLFLHGAGGMGKSTTTAQLMQAGYDLLSDDGPFFTHRNGKAYALSSLDYLHVTRNTLQLFPYLKPHLVGDMDRRGKFAVSRRELQHSDAWTKPQQITDFIQLQRGPVTRARLKNGDRQNALRELFNETMIIFRQPPLRREPQIQAYSAFIFEVVAKVMQNAEVHRLEFADHHLPEIPNLLDRLCAI